MSQKPTDKGRQRPTGVISMDYPGPNEDDPLKLPLRSDPGLTPPGSQHGFLSCKRGQMLDIMTSPLCIRFEESSTMVVLSCRSKHRCFNTKEIPLVIQEMPD